MTDVLSMFPLTPPDQAAEFQPPPPQPVAGTSVVPTEAVPDSPVVDVEHLFPLSATHGLSGKVDLSSRMSPGMENMLKTVARPVLGLAGRLARPFGTEAIDSPANPVRAMADQGVSGFTAPRDAYVEGMTQDEMVKRGMELAGLMVTAPLGAMESGAVGSGMMRLYHGTTEAPKFAAPHLSPEKARFHNPLEAKSSERGVFMTPDAETAGQYAGFGTNAYGKPVEGFAGGSVIPLDVDLKSVATLDWNKVVEKGLARGPSYFDDKAGSVHKAIEKARAAGKDFLVIKNMQDVGGAYDQVIALRPAGKVRNALTGETMFAGGMPFPLGPQRHEPDKEAK